MGNASARPNACCQERRADLDAHEAWYAGGGGIAAAVSTEEALVADHSAHGAEETGSELETGSRASEGSEQLTSEAPSAAAGCWPSASPCRGGSAGPAAEGEALDADRALIARSETGSELETASSASEGSEQLTSEAPSSNACWPSTSRFFCSCTPCCAGPAVAEALVADRAMTEEEADRIRGPLATVALEGHTYWVLAVAAFPDGRRVATASRDCTAAIWDAGAGRRLLELRGHGEWVQAVAVFPDGARVVTGSDDGTAAVWSAATGERVHELRGHGDVVSAVAVFPDGLKVATGSGDKACIWDATSGQRLLTLAGHTNHVEGVAVFPDGSKVATGSVDKTAAVWDAVSGERLLELAGHTDWVRAVAVFPDDSRLATASDDHTAAIWNAVGGQRLLMLAGHVGAVMAVAVFPEGSRVATASADKTAAVWDAATGHRLLELKGHTGELNGVAVFPDGSRVATASHDGTAMVFGSCEAPPDATREDMICAAAMQQGASNPIRGRAGLGFSAFNSSASHAASSSQAPHISAQEWLGQVIACRISMKQALGRHQGIILQPMELDRLIAEYRSFRITSFQFYRHWFPGMRGWGVMMNERGLGLFHAFVMLEAEGSIDGQKTSAYMVVEKFADKLEILCSSDVELLHAYGCRWRATGEARPISEKRPVTRDAPIQLQTGITVSQLQEWLAGPLAMVCQQYSLTARNCQHFVLNLREFLLGRADLNKLQTVMRHEKVAALIAVQRDGSALGLLSEDLQDDEDIVLAAVLQTHVALESASARLKENADVQAAADLQYLFQFGHAPEPQSAGGSDAADAHLGQQRACEALTQVGDQSAEGEDSLVKAGEHLASKLGSRRDFVLGSLLAAGIRQAQALPDGELRPQLTLLSKLGAYGSASWARAAATLGQLAQDAEPTLSGHAGPVLAVAVFPDGSRVATASQDHTAGVWDATSGHRVLELVGHTAGVRAVAVFPDGSRVATGSSDHTAGVWDSVTGRRLMTWSGHTDGVSAVAVFPDGSKVATASADSTARVWDATDGHLLLTLSGHTDRVHAVAVFPDGSRLATASNDKTAAIWSALRGQRLQELKGHSSYVLAVAVLPDGSKVATASGDRTAAIWDAATGQRLRELRGHTSWVSAVAAFPGGSRVATASLDRTAAVWDAATGRRLLELQGHRGAVLAVAVFPGGARLATASDDGTARVWRAAEAAA